jgi:hypothetical protein
LAGENGDGAVAGAVGDGVVALPEGGVLGIEPFAERVHGAGGGFAMTDLEQNEMDSGLWFHRMELKEKFGVTDRKGFQKVVCAGSPDGAEVWLVMLLGRKDGVDWVELVHHDQGVRPTGGIRRIEAQGTPEEVLLQAACLVFYPDFFRGVPFSFGHLEVLAEKVGRVLDLRRENLVLQVLEMVEYQLGKRFRHLAFWEGDLKRMGEQK